MHHGGMVVIVTITVRRMVRMTMRMRMSVCTFVLLLMVIMGLRESVEGVLRHDFDIGAGNSAAIDMADVQLRPDVERC